MEEARQHPAVTMAAPDPLPPQTTRTGAVDTPVSSRLRHRDLAGMSLQRCEVSDKREWERDEAAPIDEDARGNQPDPVHVADVRMMTTCRFGGGARRHQTRGGGPVRGRVEAADRTPPHEVETASVPLSGGAEIMRDTSCPLFSSSPPSLVLSPFSPDALRSFSPPRPRDRRRRRSLRNPASPSSRADAWRHPPMRRVPSC